MDWDFFVRRCALLIELVMLSYALLAQPATPIGTWRTHASYSNVQHLAVAPERVYGAATNGLFSVSASDNSLQLLSKNDGLGDVGVVALAYEPSRNALMLAYQSGHIDVLSDGQVTSFTLIQEANLEQAEAINHIHWVQSTAYVSTSRGVRVLRAETEGASAIRIQESYTRLSAIGDPLAIYSTTTTDDSLFLATEEGIIANALGSSANRQDFNTWRRFGSADGLPPGATRHLTQRANTIYAAVDGLGLFQYKSGTWQLTSLATEQPFNALRSTATTLVATLENQVILFNASGDLTFLANPVISAPQDALVDAQGVIWIADQNNGLVRSNGNAFTSFVPNGPASDTITGVHFVNQHLAAFEAAASGRFSVFNEGQWTSYQSPSDARLLDIAYSPAAQTYYLATFGDGLLQWDGGQTFFFAPPSPAADAEDQLTSLVLQDDQLWISRFNTAAPLLTFLPDENAWANFSSAPSIEPYPRKVIVDFSGYQWLLTGSKTAPDLPGTDVLIFDVSENRVQTVRQNAMAGNLPGDQLTDLVVDREGLVWLGGSRGVAFFPNPFGIFSNASPERPVFGSQYLLRDEYVTCLAVDGGDRKWIGTRNGLWLFNENGEELVHHFTATNSPLVSNTILDIAIDGTSGEVFVATDRGVVSYRSDATLAGATHQSVKIFPNPIRRGFDGTVGIQGLAQDAIVKITTISGGLVQELRAQGGTATWDVRNYAGQLVSNGVYLLFSTTTDGEETHIGKLAVVP